MVGPLSFLPIFLIGLTSAQCPTACSSCKMFKAGEMCGPTGDQFDCGGTWNLVEPNPNPRCINSCLYRREGDGKEFCFCDPGDLEYQPCTDLELCGTQCYNSTGVVDWNTLGVDWYTLVNNDAASCNKKCLGINPANTYFLLSGTDCGCSLTLPVVGLVDSFYCNTPCTGRDNTQCGGWWWWFDTFVNIGPIIPQPVERTDGACYNNTNQIFPDKTFLPTSNDKENCEAYCKLIEPPTFNYIGLGSTNKNKGYECYCGVDPPQSEPVAPFYCCGSPCPGNNDEECGYYQNWDGESFINVWKI